MRFYVFQCVRVEDRVLRDSPADDALYLKVAVGDHLDRSGSLEGHARVWEWTPRAFPRVCLILHLLHSMVRAWEFVYLLLCLHPDCIKAAIWMCRGDSADCDNHVLGYFVLVWGGNGFQFLEQDVLVARDCPIPGFNVCY